VTVPHPTRGDLTVVTTQYGEAYLDLEDPTEFTATASTEWGHGPDTETFNTRDNTTMTLKLTRPRGMGTYGLQGGDNAQFLVSSGSGWMIMPPNHNGAASFVDVSGWREVAKRCDANGSIQGTKWVYVRSGKNRSTTIYGYCP
jgi:hypothetical protein